MIPVRALLARPRLLIAVVAAVALFPLLPAGERLSTRLLLAWDAGVVLNLLLTWAMMARSDVDDLRTRAGAIEDVARKNRVPLVHRYDATRYLSEHKERAPTLRNQFQLNDLGYRCMAEHVARAVTVSLLQPEPPQPEPPQPEPLPQPEPPAAQKPQPELAPSNGPHGP